MAVTETSICNSALIKVGAQRILSLNEDSEQARLVKEQYEKNRDELLYAHPWNFASDRVELAAVDAEPAYEFGYKFQLPADVLRVYGSNLSQDQRWKVEGRYLVAPEPNIKILYIKKITDTSMFSPAFSEALAVKIAADISYSLTQNASLRQQLMQEYLIRLREARSFDGQESQGDRVYADSWLNARF